MRKRKPANRDGRARAQRWMLCAALVLACAAASGTPSAADKQRENTLRTVRGTVVDSHEAPLPTAVVYLKNLKTLSVRTYISDKDGHYRFSGLDPNVDYEIHAEHNDLASPTHTISSLDDRKDIVIALKLKKKK